VHIRIDGVVQGVGFRPFVRRLAARHALAGFVGNDDQGVFIEAEGDEASLLSFVRALRTEAPPLASIVAVDVARIAPVGGRAFDIVDSHRTGDRRARVAPDTATCADCVGELFDPTNRRFLYPFINCTNCGPRFTIVRDVPYDRADTTMADFAMCSVCAREYHDPDDRRYHAQPVCCPACGPSLWFEQPAGSRLGAYHLAVLARDAGTVARLRARKHREERPFALP
jgi:hydrogenase maturation protein HypF